MSNRFFFLFYLWPWTRLDVRQPKLLAMVLNSTGVVGKALKSHLSSLFSTLFDDTVGTAVEIVWAKKADVASLAKEQKSSWGKVQNLPKSPVLLLDPHKHLLLQIGFQQGTNINTWQTKIINVADQIKTGLKDFLQMDDRQGRLLCICTFLQMIVSRRNKSLCFYQYFDKGWMNLTLRTTLHHSILDCWKC